MRIAFLTLFSFILSQHFSIAQDSTIVVPKRSYKAVPLSGGNTIGIDGVLDDDGWKLAKWAGDFIEWEPDENTPPSQQTKFKIVYDKKFLYVAFRCYDTEPSKIEKRLARRDNFAGDGVAILIDSYHDKQNAFVFIVTAAGVKVDEFATENGDNFDDSWNPIWYTASNLDGEGWTAEMKIPFSQLKFGKSKEQIWGLECSRMVFRKDECLF